MTDRNRRLALKKTMQDEQNLPAQQDKPEVGAPDHLPTHPPDSLPF